MAINFATLKELVIPEGSVKKITRNSDNVMLWEKVKLITFTIEGFSCRAEAGMTWQDILYGEYAQELAQSSGWMWLDSDGDGTPVYVGADEYVAKNGKIVLSDETIIDGCAYTIITTDDPWAYM